ncbi:hypothetical protein QCA50_007734 [Cerrena zonata]|uniref:Uncharacterized protein n=1 Tax=Cerrena zonata TaxID=2478898 RepID=A0AAW0GG25_9APHY
MITRRKKKTCQTFADSLFLISSSLIPPNWAFSGVDRMNDLILLCSGGKVVPITQESHVGSHPSISGAIIFGRGRNQVGLLVEPEPDHAIDPKD